MSRTIAALEHDNERVRIVALKRGSQPISFVPEPHTQVQPGDLLRGDRHHQPFTRLAERIG